MKEVLLGIFFASYVAFGWEFCCWKKSEMKRLEIQKERYSKCGDCRFWFSLADLSLARGFCKRFPPKVIHRSDFGRDEDDKLIGHTWGNPISSKFDWCGEFQEKK